MSNFDRVLPYVLLHEGGNDDDPHDHGGRTSRGIIQREYDAYRARKGQPKGDVWEASTAEIRDIYFSQYWQPWCEQLPAGLDYVYFDFAVNAGWVQATRSLQRAIGGVHVDGQMGMVTLEACTSCQDIPALIHGYSNQRRAFYQALAQFPRYGKGWMRRAKECEAAAIALAHDRPAPKLTPDDEWTGKAKGEVAEPAVTPEQGTVITTTFGTGAATLEGAIQTAQTQIAPLQYTMRGLQIVMVLLVVAGLAVTFWGLWKRARNAKTV